jgi:hypothetical protein
MFNPLLCRNDPGVVASKGCAPLLQKTLAAIAQTSLGYSRSVCRYGAGRIAVCCSWLRGPEWRMSLSGSQAAFLPEPAPNDAPSTARRNSRSQGNCRACIATFPGPLHPERFCAPQALLQVELLASPPDSRLSSAHKARQDDEKIPPLRLSRVCAIRLKTILADLATTREPLEFRAHKLDSNITPSSRNPWPWRRGIPRYADSPSPVLISYIS